MLTNQGFDSVIIEIVLCIIFFVYKPFLQNVKCECCISLKYQYFFLLFLIKIQRAEQGQIDTFTLMVINDT